MLPSVPPVALPSLQVEVSVHDHTSLAGRLPHWSAFFANDTQVTTLSQHPAWLAVFARSMSHVPYGLEAIADGQTRGYLVLTYVHSLLFGRFLVSLPYLNYGGAVAADDATAGLLVDRAVNLANDLKVRYLELRHEKSLSHPALTPSRNDKVHMRLKLPPTAPELWKILSAKVRNQVRKAQKSELTVAWGKQELLPEFYAVFSCNMRDLGTPVYSRLLFANVLYQFPKRADICVVRAGDQPVAAAILLHGQGISEVPSASSLRSHNSSNANMLLYWHLLERAINRGQEVFDFGRSTMDSSTYRFKKQWGAVPVAAEWQHYLRQGNPAEARRDHPRYQQFIRLWQRLPVCLTRLIGPTIVRGIP